MPKIRTQNIVVYEEMLPTHPHLDPFYELSDYVSELKTTKGVFHVGTYFLMKMTTL